MKKRLFLSLLSLLCPIIIWAQSNIIGQVVEDRSELPVVGVSVYIQSSGITVITNENGEFSFENVKLPLGEQVLVVEKKDYSTKRYPIIINEDELIDLGLLFIEVDLAEEKLRMGTISLADDELDAGDDISFNVSGLLQATQDTYLRAAAFDFSATFFSPRGLDNANGKVLINGIEMNELFAGRPQWGKWGGLNDVQNNREFSMYSKANDYTFGDIAGTTNLIMRASQMRAGGRISYAASDRTYEGRVMGSYNSGILSGGWSYSVLMSRRFGDEGFREGTPYDANSFFMAVEKRINNKHSLNFTSFYTPNARGIATSITEEMRDLKGLEYNPNWGFQDGSVRSARVRTVDEPVFMLNHYWDISDKIQLNTNASYQNGKFGTTRINNGGTRLVELDGQQAFIGGALNPNPIYYQNLPSYHLRNPNPTAADFQNAWFTREQFVNGGQFRWDELYRTNINNLETGGNSTYVLQEDRVDDTQYQFNTILNAEISQSIRFSGSLSYRNLSSSNFAMLADLLGGQRFLDVDFFADENPAVVGALQDLAQSDVRNPNRQVTQGEKFQYNYIIDAEVFNSFYQLEFNYDKIDLYAAGNFGRTNFQRTGLYENGFFEGEKSFGKGKQLNFTTYGVKGGLVYKFSGRHLFEFNGAHMQNAPTIQNSYSNARQNNEIVDGLREITVNSADLSYIYRSPRLKARVTGYYNSFQNETNVGFYFTERITGLDFNNGNSFIQEVMSGIDRQHIGFEFGAEYQVTPTILLKAAGNVGQYTFTNNPDLYLTGRDFPGQQIRFGEGQTAMKNLRVPAGPQQAFQLGFEYRDPAFWNIGLTANYFDDNFISASGLVRSENFTLDQGGQPFPNYDENIAKEILRQEKFADYMIFNLTGGKSWRVRGPGNKNYFVGFFAVISNLFDQEFVTGGFEQSRRADFQNRTEDLTRPNGPMFGNRYFYGFGRTYYANFYIRF